ncbi:MAG: hypothetical protein FD123_414 [Bacteroidetes bacterium]|nr:MAG: hypothetical protein FD123_414 [Bacteroidota bacterium]
MRILAWILVIQYLIIINTSCSNRKKCQKFISYNGKKVDLEGLKMKIGRPDVDAGVGKISIDPKNYRTASDSLQLLDLIQYQICDQLSKLPEGHEKQNLSKKYTETLIRMYEMALHPEGVKINTKASEISPKMKGQWIYTYTNDKYQDGGVFTVKQDGPRLKIIGERMWIDTAAADGYWDCYQYNSPKTWHSTWAIIDSNEIHVDYSIENINNENINGYIRGDVTVDSNNQVVRVKGRFYQLIPSKPIAGEIEFVRTKNDSTYIHPTWQKNHKCGGRPLPPSLPSSGGSSKQGRTLSRYSGSHVEFTPYPGQLIKGQKGYYYYVDLYDLSFDDEKRINLNDKSKVIHRKTFTFPGGECSENATAGGFANAFKLFYHIYDSLLRANKNVHVYVLGSADAITFDPKTPKSACNFNKVEFFPLEDSTGMYIPKIETKQIALPYVNASLPFLRACFMQNKLEETGENGVPSTVLESRVTDQVSLQDRNVTIFLYHDD